MPVVEHRQMTDRRQFDVACASQALVILRHDVIVVGIAQTDCRHIERLAGHVAQPQRTGFHFTCIAAETETGEFSSMVRCGERQQAADSIAAMPGEVGTTNQAAHAVRQ